MRLMLRLMVKMFINLHNLQLLRARNTRHLAEQIVHPLRTQVNAPLVNLCYSDFISTPTLRVCILMFVDG